MTLPRRTRALALVAGLALLAACNDTEGTDAMPAPTVPTTASTTPATVDANGTTLAFTRRGTGAPLLLVHGGGEDAAMLDAQAASLAAAGYEVVTYDRRGTGGSGRDDWPGRGAAQHADDAAALLDALDLSPATVVGVSSGGVIALELAQRHPEAVARVVAWEPPAAGVIPGGREVTAEIMAPVDAHLAAHPGDFVGAQAILLGAVVGFPVTVDDPAFASARVNAEPFVLDEPAITLAALPPEGFVGRDVTIAVGSAPNEVVAAASEILAAVIGRAPVRVDGDHEVYLRDPAVLTAVVTGRPTA
jgi:pimeloyl-ACP methyl ester carboxylesterase